MEHESRMARGGRFSSPVRAVKSFSSDAIYTCELWTEWYTRNVALASKPDKTSELAARTAQGIIDEGKLRNEETVATEMAAELIQCGADRQKLKECAVKLYSKNNFLYGLLNTTLRNNDLSKIDTLGPFCYLVNSYISQTNALTEELTIYRGMTLTDEMIREYEEAIGTEIDWPAFTSTSKTRAVAEMFAGNALCIIKVPPGAYIHGRDISAVSHMAHEDEFLLSVAFPLYVEKVEFDPAEKRHLIYLRSTE